MLRKRASQLRCTPRYSGSCSVLGLVYSSLRVVIFELPTMLLMLSVSSWTAGGVSDASGAGVVVVKYLRQSFGHSTSLRPPACA